VAGHTPTARLSLSIPLAGLQSSIFFAGSAGIALRNKQGPRACGNFWNCSALKSESSMPVGCIIASFWGNISNFGHPFFGLARSGSLERTMAISALVERAKAAKIENGIRGFCSRNPLQCAPLNVARKTR
jgi:hypothetical protein